MHWCTTDRHAVPVMLVVDYPFCLRKSQQTLLTLLLDPFTISIYSKTQPSDSM